MFSSINELLLRVSVYSRNVMCFSLRLGKFDITFAIQIDLFSNEMLRDKYYNHAIL